MKVKVIEIDGAYAVSVNGEVVAAGLSNAQAWREADRLESDIAESDNDRVWRYQRQR
jgi:hypothetical protein